MGKANNNVLPPTTPVTVSLTLTLAEANNLLVALANAINNLGPKKGGKGGGSKGGGSKGTSKGGGSKGGGSKGGGSKGQAKGGKTRH